MPIYEYRCQQCGHQFDILQKISDAPLSRCPDCGKDTLNKLVSRSSFQLKGTGWYATDFKNSGKPADKKDKAATEAKTATATDTGSAATTTDTAKTDTSKAA